MDLVNILTLSDQGEIALVKSVLESEGIPYCVEGENMSIMYSGVLPARVLVPADRVDDAIEALSDMNFGLEPPPTKPGEN